MAPHRVTKPTARGLAQAASLSSRAYVTFLAGDGDYVKGVVGLAKGLRKVKAAYPLVVAVLNDVPEEHSGMLVSQGCMVREIGWVHPPENGTKFAWEYYAINYSKLRIWEGFLPGEGIASSPPLPGPTIMRRAATVAVRVLGFGKASFSREVVGIRNLISGTVLGVYPRSLLLGGTGVCLTAGVVNVGVGVRRRWRDRRQ
ncbi:hypothetical protein RHSIM_Rhsim01G0129900 [Rhododendron simsii]|uniref:Hexosyltransferase n=1 Tax=Rhododendron simsii TaxID=118357 RepID=A0A834LXP8_RHOSS|nr:hypothetical protein RHSIM_Rhsim01G0129900 [Rhododendron simsii]